jgi:hypothetical protein
MKYIYHYHLIVPLRNRSTKHHCGALVRTAPIGDAEDYQNAIAYLCKHHRAKPGNVIVSAFSLLNPQPAP